MVRGDSATEARAGAGRGFWQGQLEGREAALGSLRKLELFWDLKKVKLDC